MAPPSTDAVLSLKIQSLMQVFSHLPSKNTVPYAPLTFVKLHPEILILFVVSKSIAAPPPEFEEGLSFIASRFSKEESIILRPVTSDFTLVNKAKPLSLHVPLLIVE